MKTKFTTAGRDWQVGERVIVLSNHTMAATPRVLRIQRVAPKSFVVDDERYQRDKLEDGVPTRQVGSGWGRFRVQVIPLEHPDAELLLAKRALYKQLRTVLAATTEWEKDRTVDHAESLRSELNDWIDARKALDEVEAKRDGR
jgi:hypothetical protein